MVSKPSRSNEKVCLIGSHYNFINNNTTCNKMTNKRDLIEQKWLQTDNYYFFAGILPMSEVAAVCTQY